MKKRLQYGLIVCLVVGIFGGIGFYAQWSNADTIGERDTYFYHRSFWNQVTEQLCEVLERTGARYYCITKILNENHEPEYEVLVELDNDDDTIRETVSYYDLSQLMSAKEAAIVRRALDNYVDVIEVGNTIVAKESVLFITEETEGFFDSMVYFYGPTECMDAEQTAYEHLEDQWYLCQTK